MAPSRRSRIAFGRINRRREGQPTLAARSFQEDMIDLAMSHRTETEIGGRRWIASDMELRDNDESMVGLLGFEVSDQVRSFAEADFSWVKGDTYAFTGALEDTVVPFAVDLREHRRWVAAATSSRIQHSAFATGLAAVLNAAVQELGLMPTDWEVDSITSRSNVLDWVEHHTGITKFRRVLKFSNPGRDLDEDRAEMRALNATVLDQEFRALRGNHLQLRGNPAFEQLLEGIERGDVEVNLEAEEGGNYDRFRSKESPDETFVDAFRNLSDGMDTVLGALRVYSVQQERRTGIA